MKTFDTNSINSLIELMKERKKIAIISHHNPDGDAIGSVLSLYHMHKADHDIKMVVPSAFPDFLSWLADSELIINAQKNKEEACLQINEAEVIICVDFNTVKRVQALSECLENSKAFKVLIDHHPQPVKEEFDIVFSDTDQSSTAELIYHLSVLCEWEPLMNKDFSESCMTGIMTDTGSFSFACDRIETFDAVKGLLQKGAVISHINRSIFSQVPFNRLQLMGFSLSSKLKRIGPNNEIAFISLSTKEMNRFKYKTGDTEGLVNWALAVKGVRVAALITEQKDNIKFSFRSIDNLSVNQFARSFFNGGGHTNAAGGKYVGSLKEAVQYFEKQAVEFIKE